MVGPAFGTVAPVVDWLEGWPAPTVVSDPAAFVAAAQTAVILPRHTQPFVYTAPVQQA